MLLGKALGFVRETLIAGYFGTSGQTDAYLVATLVPLVLFPTVSIGFSTVLVPVLTEYAERDPDQYRAAVGSALRGIMLVIAAILAVTYPFIPQIIHLLAPGFAGAQFDLAVSLARIVFPMMACLGISQWAVGILQSRERFLESAGMFVPFNAIVIVVLLLAAGHLGIKALAVATLAGSVSMVLITVPGLIRERLLFCREGSLRHPAVLKLGGMVASIVVVSNIGQINMVVSRMLSSGLPAGSLTSVNLTELLVAVPVAAVGSPIAMMAYTRLAQLATRGEMERYGAELGLALRRITMLLLPLAIGLGFFREEAVRVLFQRGAFDERGVALTAFALLFGVVAIPAMAWQEMLSRSFYALQDTRTPLIATVGAGVVAVGLSFLFMGRLAHGGLLLATACGYYLQNLIYLIRMHRRLGGAALGRELISGMVEVGTAGAAMSVFLWSAGGWASGAGGWAFGVVPATAPAAAGGVLSKLVLLERIAVLGLPALLVYVGALFAFHPGRYVQAVRGVVLRRLAPER